MPDQQMTYGDPSASGLLWRLPVVRDDHTQAETLVRDAERPLLGLHARARDCARRWPPERFAAVGTALLERHGGTLVLLGNEEAAPASAWIAREAQRAGGSCLDLSGHTTLPVLGAVIARLAVLVTNDSGPAHIAYAADAPSVTTYGGAHPEAYGPLAYGTHLLAIHDVLCRPHDALTCSTCAHDYACLDGVTIDQVLALAEDAIYASTVGNWIRH